jgi:hypothetical protein
LPKLNLSSLLEGFALAAGILPSTWQTVPRHRGALARPEVRIEDVMLKFDIKYLDLPLSGQSEAGNRDE